MRVSNYLREVILQAIQESFGDCEVILFGSRVDDSKRGGDFDIAIKSNLSKEAFRAAKVQFIKYLMLKDLDLAIDLVAYEYIPQTLKQEIDQKGVVLSTYQTQNRQSANKRTGSFIGMLDGKIGDESYKEMQSSHHHKRVE